MANNVRMDLFLQKANQLNDANEIGALQSMLHSEMKANKRHRNNDMKSSTFNEQSAEYMTEINRGKNPSFLQNADLQSVSGRVPLTTPP